MLSESLRERSEPGGDPARVLPVAQRRPRGVVHDVRVGLRELGHLQRDRGVRRQRRAVRYRVAIRLGGALAEVVLVLEEVLAEDGVNDRADAAPVEDVDLRHPEKDALEEVAYEVDGDVVRRRVDERDDLPHAALDLDDWDGERLLAAEQLDEATERDNCIDERDVVRDLLHRESVLDGAGDPLELLTPRASGSLLTGNVVEELNYARLSERCRGSARSAL